MLLAPYFARMQVYLHPDPEPVKWRYAGGQATRMPARESPEKLEPYE
jgi:hypothetical protein